MDDPSQHDVGSLRRLVDLSLELGRNQEVGKVLQAVANAMLELVHADRAFVILSEKHVVASAFREGHGGSPSLSVARFALKEGREVVTSDIGDHDELAASRSVMNLQLQTVLCVPLYAGEEVIGALYADSARRGHEELRQVVWLARAYAAHASLALKNARTLAEARLQSLRAREAAHDIRNLAGSIDMGLDELEDLELPEWARENLRDVRAMNRLAMCTATTTLSRKRPERVLLEVRGVVERAVGLLRYDAKRKSVHLQAELEEVRVKGVAADLSRVVANLVGNALKYSPEGGTVRIRLEDEGKQARLTVSDEGPGIPKENLRTIFESGVQLEGSEEGFGLGLGICKTLIKQHRGAIRAKSSSKGALIEVLLPAIS